jgi:hypothetical protein
MMLADLMFRFINFEIRIIPLSHLLEEEVTTFPLPNYKGCEGNMLYFMFNTTCFGQHHRHNHTLPLVFLLYSLTKVFSAGMYGV